MTKIVMIRHGQSQWNLENRFTGWTDVDLSEKGIQEARNAGKLLQKNGFSFDVGFTSVLKRAIRTLWLILDELDEMWIPVHHSWKLNERHYGALQGLNKKETAAQYGENQVHVWRRSFDVQPPKLEMTDKRYSAGDRRYKSLKPEQLPLTETLKDTIERILPYWNESIMPEVKAGKNVIISAHGNSIRAVIKHLNNLSDEEILDVEVPTGIPLVYELDENYHAVKHYYLREDSQEEISPH